MKFADFIETGAIQADLQAADKEGVIEELIEALVKAGGVKEDDHVSIVEAVMKREELGSTGIGRGVAVPHTKHPSVDRLIGTVGNTGNARTTPPNLHFGIYSHGPIDPYHFIAETDTVPSRISGDSLLLGKMVRTKQLVEVRKSPALSSLSLDTLLGDSQVKVVAITGKQFRIELPNGSLGYIAEKQVELFLDTLEQKANSTPVP